MQNGIAEFSAWLAATAASRAVAGPAWTVPSIQTVHILAIGVLMASAVMLNLRLLNLTGRNMTVAASSSRFVPWIWGGAVVLALSGALLVLAEPDRELPNPTFQLKMLLVALAVALTAAAHRALRSEGNRPLGRLAALLSLALWVAIAVCGRWIAYTL